MIGSAGSSMITAARQNANRLGYHLQNVGFYTFVDAFETNWVITNTDQRLRATRRNRN